MVYFLNLKLVALLNYCTKSLEASLLPNEGLAREPAHFIADGATEVLSDNLVIVSIVSWVEFFGFVVFKLWVLFGEAVGDYLATEEPAAHDLKLWLLAEDSHATESVFCSVLRSVHEAIHQVVRDVELVALALVNVVVEVPEGPALPVKLLIKLAHSLALFVFVINEEGLEIKEIERTGG